MYIITNEMDNIKMNSIAHILVLCCYILKEDVRTENKENQWMGVTVQSQGPGGKIVVSTTECLHCCSQ